MDNPDRWRFFWKIEFFISMSLKPKRIVRHFLLFLSLFFSQSVILMRSWLGFLSFPLNLFGGLFRDYSFSTGV